MKKSTKKTTKINLTDKFITDTLGSLDKLIDNLTLKQKHDEEAVIKLIFAHLGFLVAYIDGEKELKRLVGEIQKDVKAYVKLEKKHLKEKAPAPKKAVKAKAKKK